jgi:polyisoprenoid-binding protein YceI
MKVVIVGALGVLLVLGVLVFGLGGQDESAVTTEVSSEELAVNNSSEEVEMVDETEREDETRSVVSPGTYAVNSELSIVNWAGQKPLIDGYINTGSIAVTEGTIEVGENEASGNFTIDMNTLSVSETPTKPGSESAFEGHLKGERWFDVETYPEASFVITSVVPREDSEATFEYDVTGNLTMKGETGELTFPATIFEDEFGRVQAIADFEFDRTEWGITAGSGSFFDNLADNVIDDMVSLSFNIVTEAP